MSLHVCLKLACSIQWPPTKLAIRNALTNYYYLAICWWQKGKPMSVCAKISRYIGNGPLSFIILQQCFSMPISNWDIINVVGCVRQYLLPNRLFEAFGSQFIYFVCHFFPCVFWRVCALDLIRLYCFIYLDIWVEIVFVYHSVYLV